MMTPEGRVKAAITRHLKASGCWYFMPVPGGFGRRTVDYLGCYKGRFFAIEAKQPGKKPTALQEMELRSIQEQGGITFVIDAVFCPSMALLATFLDVPTP